MLDTYDQNRYRIITRNYQVLCLNKVLKYERSYYVCFNLQRYFVNDIFSMTPWSVASPTHTKTWTFSLNSTSDRVSVLCVVIELSDGVNITPIKDHKVEALSTTSWWKSTTWPDIRVYIQMIFQKDKVLCKCHHCNFKLRS